MNLRDSLPLKKPVKALKLTEFVILIAAMTSFTALSLNAVLPSLNAVAVDFGITDANRTQLVVSLFVFGMTFGELLFGPISDAIGRKRAIMLGLVIYSIGTIMAMFATSLSQLLVARIVQGVGVAGPKIGSRALVRDLYEGEKMARVASLIFMVFILVPMVGPMFGQAILWVGNWQSLYGVFLAIVLVIGLWFVIRQPETLSTEQRIPLKFSSLKVSAKSILAIRTVWVYAICSGLIFGMQVLYMSTAQAMFFDFYGIGDSFTIYYALFALSIGLASLTNSQIVERLGMRRLVITALSLLLLLSSSMIMLSWQSDGIPSFTVFMGIFLAQFFCIGMLFGNLSALAMQPLRQAAGLGASLIAAISSLVATAVAIVIGYFYAGNVYPIAIGYIFASIVALVLVIFVAKPSKPSDTPPSSPDQSSDDEDELPEHRRRLPNVAIR